MAEQHLCTVCGEPMSEAESMFKFHGYSGPCPKPPLPKPATTKTETLKVAVYWPESADYGSTTTCKTMEQAENEARENERLGYGDGSHNRGVIHIIRTIREVTEWKISPESAARFAVENAERADKPKRKR